MDIVTNRVTPRTMVRQVPYHYEQRRMLAVLGDVGSAKTFACIQGAHETARKLFDQEQAVNAALRRPNPGEFFYIVITLSDKEPYDLLVPNVTNNQYAQLPIGDLPGADDTWPSQEELFGIVIFDELTSNPEMFKNVRQMINERKIGSYLVPDGVSFIGSGNRVQDRASSFPLTRDFITASTVLEMKNEVDEFLDPDINTVWKKYGAIHPALALCCKLFADNMFFVTEPPDGADPNEPFNRTRCITAASRMMNHSDFDWDDPMWKTMIRGTMGAQATNALAGVLSAGESLIHMDRWYEDPEGSRQEIRDFYHESMNEAHVKVAFLLFLAKKCKKDASNFGKCMRLVSVFQDKEMSRSFVVTAISQNKEVKNHPEIGKLYGSNKEFYF
jgi:hypothetical protein